MSRRAHSPLPDEEDAVLLHQHEPPNQPSVHGPVGLRHLMLLLLFSCGTLCYADRTNLSVALVAMRREFDWDGRTAGSLLSAFWFGYLCTQVPGGYCTARYGAKVTLVTGVLCWSALTVATPFFAAISVEALFAVRVVVGLSEGVAIPAITSIVAAWFPETERSRALAVTSTGQLCGTVAAFGCAPLVDAHWPAIFYLFGSLGFVWAALFQMLATSLPQQHPCISETERHLLSSAVAPPQINSFSSSIAYGDGDEGAPCGDPSNSEDVGMVRARGRKNCHSADDPSRPCSDQHALQDPASLFRRLSREPAFLSICAAHFGNNWGQYLLLSWLPLYLTSLGLELKSSGSLFSAPYIFAAVTNVTGAWVADRALLQYLRLSLRTTRKIMQLVAHSTPIVCFACIGFTSNATMALVLLTLSVSAMALSTSGYSANVIDICGGRADRTALLYGVVNTVGTFPGILASWLAGLMITGQGTRAEWARVFGLAMIVLTVGLTSFLRYAKGSDIFTRPNINAEPISRSLLVG